MPLNKQRSGAASDAVSQELVSAPQGKRSLDKTLYQLQVSNRTLGTV